MHSKTIVLVVIAESVILSISALDATDVVCDSKYVMEEVPPLSTIPHIRQGIQTVSVAPALPEFVVVLEYPVAKDKPFESIVTCLFVIAGIPEFAPMVDVSNTHNCLGESLVILQML